MYQHFTHMKYCIRCGDVVLYGCFCSDILWMYEFSFISMYMHDKCFKWDKKTQTVLWVLSAFSGHKHYQKSLHVLLILGYGITRKTCYSFQYFHSSCIPNPLVMVRLTGQFHPLIMIQCSFVWHFCKCCYVILITVFTTVNSFMTVNYTHYQRTPLCW